MCGIAGFWGDVFPRQQARARLDRMTAAIAHRGPDGQACWLSEQGDVGLGHTRLAVIDLCSGDQPMWDADRRAVIVFNGEIYNHRELRAQLEPMGFAFRTRSDTEVIAAAVRAWGTEGGLRRLRGMFAFGLYDSGSRRLLLARDRVGIKPLYYSRSPAGLIFGSEQKALLAASIVPTRVNPVAIHDYLAQGYAMTPATCWSDISLLEPGAWLEIGPGGVRSGRYWNWHAYEETTLSFQQATERTRQVLHDALRCHLISDVPLATFLSGGLDSSLMVAMLSRDLLPGMQTFTMGFDDRDFDESGIAREVARQVKTDHHEVRMETGHGDPDLFARVLEQYDEPFGDSSCLPTYMVCREMRRHVKVALSGDGGDEVLGGYVRYTRARQLAALARCHAAAPLVGPAVRLVRRRMGRRGDQVAKAWEYSQLPREAMLLSLHTYFSEQERLGLYRPEFARLALADGPTVERFAPCVPAYEADPVKQLTLAEFRMRLHADYLRKVDIASSAHGLEVRVPYLDNALCEHAMSLPTSYKLTASGHTKLIARRLAQDLLPPLVARRAKKGFSIPLDRWMGPRLQAFLEDLVLDPRARMYAWLRPEAVMEVWRAFARPGDADHTSRFQRYQRAFLLVSLELWLRRWEPAV